MVKVLRKKLKHWVHSRYLLPGVTLASFLESTIVPIPIETLLIPLSQLRRDKVWHIATVATLGCILGALLAYMIGFWVFDIFKDDIIRAFGDPELFTNIQQRMADEGFWFIVLAGILPIPLQLAMVAAGVSAYPIGWFILAIALSRILRYFGIAWLVLLFGNQAENVLRKYKWKAIFFVSLVIFLIWGLQILLK